MSATLHISTDRGKLDIALIHAFLANDSSWARGISLDTVRRSIEHSLCFGGYVDGAQVAFARVITDHATFANLMDVFVLPGQRGRGHAASLMRAVLAYPGLQQLRRFTLATSGAHGLYARFGFHAPTRPSSLMEMYVPDIYTAKSPQMNKPTRFKSMDS